MSQKPENVDVQGFYQNDSRLGGHAPYAPSTGNQYGMQMATPGGIVTSQAVLVVESERHWTWSWCPTVAAAFAFFLCPLAGYIATVMSLLSYTDHQNQKYNKAKSKKNVAFCCGITGIIVGATLITIYIITLALTISRANNRVVNFNNS